MIATIAFLAATAVCEPAILEARYDLVPNVTAPQDGGSRRRGGSPPPGGGTPEPALMLLLGGAGLGYGAFKMGRRRKQEAQKGN